MTYKSVCRLMSVFCLVFLNIMIAGPVSFLPQINRQEALYAWGLGAVVFAILGAGGKSD